MVFGVIQFTDTTSVTADCKSTVTDVSGSATRNDEEDYKSSPQIPSDCKSKGRNEKDYTNTITRSG